MSLELHLNGAGATAVEPAALELLRRLGAGSPAREVVTADGARVRGKTDRAIAIAGVVLALPGAIGATLDLTARKQVAEQVQAVCRDAEAHDIDVTIVIDGDAINLRRSSTDAVVDRLLEEPGR